MLQERSPLWNNTTGCLSSWYPCAPYQWNHDRLVRHMGTVSTMPGSEGRRGQRQEMDARRRDLRRKGFTVVSGWGIRRREQAGTEFGFAPQQQVAFNRRLWGHQGCSLDGWSH